MNKNIYNKIVSKISETRNLYDKTRARGKNAQVDPTTQLVEIEGHINRILKFLKLSKEADASIVSMHMKTLSLTAKARKGEERFAFLQAEN